MNMLINATPNPTMSSREIAVLADKRHDHVMADIRAMLESLNIQSTEFSGDYIDPRGRTYPCFNLPKRETLILVSGYNIAMRAKIIDRWQELEAAQFKAPAQLTTLEILQMAMQAEQGRLQAIAERDHAIATKAQIGSKREATAMANTATANRKLKAIEAELGRCIDHATILAVQNATGCEYSWRPLKAYCTAKGIDPVKVHCPRFKFVQSWPAEAWLEVHGVDIVALFGGVEV